MCQSEVWLGSSPSMQVQAPIWVVQFQTHVQTFWQQSSLLQGNIPGSQTHALKASRCALRNLRCRYSEFPKPEELRRTGLSWGCGSNVLLCTQWDLPTHSCPRKILWHRTQQQPAASVIISVTLLADSEVPVGTRKKAAAGQGWSAGVREGDSDTGGAWQCRVWTHRLTCTNTAILCPLRSSLSTQHLSGGGSACLSDFQPVFCTDVDSAVVMRPKYQPAFHQALRLQATDCLCLTPVMSSTATLILATVTCSSWWCQQWQILLPGINQGFQKKLLHLRVHLKPAGARARCSFDLPLLLITEVGGGLILRLKQEK